MPTFDGTDTSNNQGAQVVNIGPQLVAAGAEGWWHKATQGSSFRDKYWPAVRAAAEDVGLRYRGPYHWLSPTSPVEAQFDNFVGFVGDLREGECVQLDVEDPGGLPDAMVFEAIDYWEDRYPGRVIVYTGRYYMPYKPVWVLSYLIDRLIERYGDNLQWWLPWYTSTYPGSQLPTTPVMWQWAGGANGVLIEGVGRIDSNEIIDRRRLDLLCYGISSGPGGGLPLPGPGPAPTPPEVDMTQFTLFPCTDDPAVFGGMFDGHQVHVVEWMSAADAAHYRAETPPTPELPVSTGSFHYTTLIGPLPPGWTASRFRRVADASHGPTGETGATGPAPHGTFPITGGSVTF